MIKKEVVGGIGCITLNRPEKFNALSVKMIDQLLLVVKEFERRKDVKGIIIYGQGKHLCAGMDVNEIASASKKKALEIAKKGLKACEAIESSKKVYLCCMKGYVLGGGLEIALSCDLRICDKTVKCGLPEAKLGIVPGFGGITRITNLCGKSVCQKIVLGNMMFDWKESLNAGIVHKVESNAEISGKKWMKLVVEQSGESLGLCKKLLKGSNYKKDVDAFASCFGTKEQINRMKRFRS